jgi:hypothetical protein
MNVYTAIALLGGGKGIGVGTEPVIQSEAEKRDLNISNYP